MLNRIKGGLVGLAVGDALGVSVEFMEPNRIQQQWGYVTEITGGGIFGFEKGEVTDDTEMTLCLARGILKNPSSPIEEIGNEFIEWIATNPKDVGETIKLSLSNYYSLKNWEQASEFTHKMLMGKSAGNGTLMRTLPISLAYNNEEVVDYLAKKQSKLTHFDDLAGEVCSLYNQIAIRLLNGEYLMDAIFRVVQDTPYEYVLHEKPDSIPNGYVVNTFNWSLYALLNTSSFEEAVQMAVNFGFDADTTGAVTGGLAGIYYGYDAIPEKYREALIKKKEIEEVAGQLFELKKLNQ